MKGRGRNAAARNNPMKISLAVLATCALTQAALAKEGDCRSIESASKRLACYDAAYPPRVAKPAVDSDAARAAWKDPFAEEEARTAARLKNICRGC